MNNEQLKRFLSIHNLKAPTGFDVSSSDITDATEDEIDSRDEPNLVFSPAWGGGRKKDWCTNERRLFLGYNNVPPKSKAIQ